MTDYKRVLINLGDDYDYRLDWIKYGKECESGRNDEAKFRIIAFGPLAMLFDFQTEEFVGYHDFYHNRYIERQ